MSAHVTSAVIAELRAIRQDQKVSARELAERMTAVGYPIQRSVIANLESERRDEVSVDHLAAAALALGADAATILRRATSPCPHCKGEPPPGFTCNTCGTPRMADEAEKGTGPIEPADFFEPGRTYAYALWQFRCDTITRHPETGKRTALGWFRGSGGPWRPFSSNEQEWAEGAWTDVTA